MRRIMIYMTGMVLSIFLFASAVMAADSLKHGTIIVPCDYEDAIKMSEDAYRRNPESEQALANLAMVYDSAGWYGQSVQLWERYLDHSTWTGYRKIAERRAAWTNRWVGSARFLLGDPAGESRRNLIRAVQINPMMSEAWVWHAHIAISEGRYRFAESVASAMLDDPGYEETAKVLLQQARSGSAQLGNASESMQNGIALYDSGRFAEALEAFQKADRIKPGLSVVNYWKGVTMDTLHRPTEAASEFFKVRFARPDIYRYAILYEQAKLKSNAFDFRVSDHSDPSRFASFERRLPQMEIADEGEGLLVFCSRP